MLRVNGRTLYAMLRDARNRQLVLWGGLEDDAVFVKQRLSALGIKAPIVGNDVLADGSLSGTHMIVMLHDDYLAAADLLDSWGYRAGEDYRWIKRYGNENLRTKYSYDPMLGFDSLGDELTPGYFRHGEETENSKRVMVLGGSTADPGTFMSSCWPELLAHLMSSRGVDAVVYNGAVTGYTSAQELGKLLRDTGAIRPDVVVLYSGINNNHLVAGYPFLIDYQVKLGHVLSGENLPTVNLSRLEPWRQVEYCSDDFDRYSWWLAHMRLAHEFCSMFGIRCHCILGPNLMTKSIEKLLPDECEYLLNRSFMGRPGLTPQGYRDLALGFCETVAAQQPSDWLHDFSHVFDETNEAVYEDAIHVNRLGNELIASAVWELIKHDVS